MALIQNEDGTVRKRKGNKIAIDITPRNLKNLQNRFKDNPFTGGSNLDKAI